MIPQTNTNSRNPPRRWWRRGTWRLGRCQRPNGCAPRAQLPAEELLSTLQGSTHETPTRSDGARPSSSSTGAGSCVHDNRVWTGVGCRGQQHGLRCSFWRRTTQHSDGQPPSLARRVRRPRQEQHSSGCERGATMQRKLGGSEGRERATGSSSTISSAGSSAGSSACGAVAREWNRTAVRAHVA